MSNETSKHKEAALKCGFIVIRLAERVSTSGVSETEEARKAADTSTNG